MHDRQQTDLLPDVHFRNAPSKMAANLGR